MTTAVRPTAAAPEDDPVSARILVLTLGGTIASVPSAAGAGGGAVPTLTGADLVASVPGLAEVAQLETRSLRQLPSCDLTHADIAEVGAVIDEALAAGSTDGVVVVQGTDTIEETAYLLDLLGDRPAPVVVTGAMRTPATPGADGPANLLAAVTVAASPQAAGLGVLVVLADEIHAAARVHKAHSSAPHAFASPGHGAVGRVVEGTARIAMRPVRDEADGPYVLPADVTWPCVPILRVAVGTGAHEVQALAAIADALVVEAPGGGHVPSWIVAALQEAAARVPVVLASRTGAGGTLESTYGYPGSELDLLEKGLVSAGYRDAVKARLWLGVRLAADAWSAPARADEG